MDTYYSVLAVPSGATPEQIEHAYQQQRSRYSAEHITDMGEEFARIAAAKLAALDQARMVLADPVQRRAYDRSIGAGGAPARAPRPTKRARAREWLMLGSGALVGLLIIAGVALFSARTAAPALPAVAEVNRPAPDFTLAKLDGTPVKLSDYRGKVVVINFWYTNCAPCREETPALQQAYRQLADKGLVVLGVNVRKNERPGADGDQDIQKFVSQFGVTYPIVLDSARDTGSAYQIYVLPTSIFIDPNGQERYRSFSAVTAQDVEQLFTQLQQQTTASVGTK